MDSLVGYFDTTYFISRSFGVSSQSTKLKINVNTRLGLVFLISFPLHSRRFGGVCKGQDFWQFSAQPGRAGQGARAQVQVYVTIALLLYSYFVSETACAENMSLSDILPSFVQRILLIFGPESPVVQGTFGPVPQGPRLTPLEYTYSTNRKSFRNPFETQFDAILLYQKVGNGKLPLQKTSFKVQVMTLANGGCLRLFHSRPTRVAFSFVYFVRPCVGFLLPL